MTREEILAMQPGRELDALVAGKVFDLQIRWQRDEWTDPYPIDERDVIVDNFSTDISAAWEVVEKMKEWKWWIVLSTEGEKWNACYYWDPTQVSFDIEFAAVTAPEAICKAALIAVME